MIRKPLYLLGGGISGNLQHPKESVSFQGSIQPLPNPLTLTPISTAARKNTDQGVVHKHTRTYTHTLCTVTSDSDLLLLTIPLTTFYDHAA